MRTSNRSRHRHLSLEEIPRAFERANLPESEDRSLAWETRLRRGRVIADGAATHLGSNWLSAETYSSASCRSKDTTTKMRSSSAKSWFETTFTLRSTSKKFDVEIRETKLGREEFTRDIPNVSEKALRNLDENGHRSSRNLCSTRRHSGRQGFSKEQDRTDAGRKTASCDFRSCRRRREE